MGAELVVEAALSAGAAAGLTASASTAITDAYTSLKHALGRRIELVYRSRKAGAEAAHRIVAEHSADPVPHRDDLVALLAALDLAADDENDEVFAAARRVLSLIGEPLPGSERGGVTIRDAKGVQVGDGNIQINKFS